MEKKLKLIIPWSNSSGVKKMLLCMKLTLVIFLVAVLQTWAAVSYSQTTTLSINLKNATVQTVLQQVEDQSEFYFLYSRSLIDVDRTVDVQLKDAKINEVLNALFSGTDVAYKVDGRQIVLSRRSESSVFGMQQQKSVTGKVTDSTGGPLPGVSVVVKGTTTGVITDANGNYSLSSVPENAVLQFSFVGMKGQEIVVGGKTTVNLKMEEETVGIEEVVAIGYGTMKKSDLTGAVSSVSTKDIGISAISNSARILQGRAAGVIVTSESGSPGAGINIRIRGLGTINNNDPLYIIDGMPASNMNDLNPTDIASLEILKDASSSAIYGSRAANGVVLITTKKGSAGKTKVHFETYTGASNSYNRIDQLDADQYYEMMKLAHKNGGTAIPPYLESEYKKGYNTNWWDEVTQTGKTQNYFLSITGGTDKVRYALSGGYFKEEGIIKKTEYERFSFRTNVDADISKNAKVGINLGITNSLRTKIDEANRWAMGNIGHTFIFDPIVPVIDPNADINSPDYEFNKFGSSLISDAANPVAYIARTFDDTKNFNILGNAYIEYTIVPGLVFKSNLGLDVTNLNRYRYSPRYYLNARQYSNNSKVTRDYNNIEGLVFENTLSYSKQINQDHNINALVGITTEKYMDDGFSAAKQGTLYNDENLRVLSAATMSDQASGTKNENSLLSYLGRINYNYRNKYLLTATIRRDGSSRFAEGNQWGTFPSMSVGWRLSEEDFFKQLNPGFIDNLKLRIGWGQIGNQNIGNSAYLSLISGGNSKRYVLGGSVFQGYSPSSIGNPDIKWETVEQSNLAVDMELFNNKLSVSADYYIKKTKDMLLNIPLPYYSGYPTTPVSNAGSIQNKGLEIQLNHRQNIRDFGYEVGLNFTTVKNEVLSLGSQASIFGGQSRVGLVTKTEVGHPIGSFFGFVMDGIFQDATEVSNGHQPLAIPGDIRFKDLAGKPDVNGNPTGPDGVINEYDKTYIGSPIPDFLLGFNIGLNYKNFDIKIFAQGTFGNEIYNASKVFTHSPMGKYNTSLDAWETAWHGTGTSNTQPIISSVNNNDNFRNSSFYVEDGSFLRIKNTEIGYTIPQAIINKLRLGGVRIFLSGQNLMTFTKYKGLDPEIGSNTLLDVGVDYNTFPNSRTIMAGLNVNF